MKRFLAFVNVHPIKVLKGGTCISERLRDKIVILLFFCEKDFTKYFAKIFCQKIYFLNIKFQFFLNKMNFIFSSLEYYSGETKKENSRKNNYV